MELPQYTLKQSVNRMLAPWILKLLGLAILFYGGIYFNVKYAMGKEIPSFVNLFIFAFLIVLVATQSVIYHVRFGKYKFLFYTNRIEYVAKKTTTLMFSDLDKIELKQNMFDKMFNTGSLKLSEGFIVGPISNVAQIKSYLEQLLKYYVYSQQKYRAQAAQQQVR